MYDALPTYLTLKTFGCLYFAYILENNISKLGSRARSGAFLGYKDGVKGYIVLNINTRELFISRNVIFYENGFPIKTIKTIEKPIMRKKTKLPFLMTFYTTITLWILRD